MKILAQQSPNRYLIGVDGKDGFVADLDEGKRYPTHSIASIAARGYWLELELSSTEEKTILDKVDKLKEPT